MCQSSPQTAPIFTTIFHAAFSQFFVSHGLVGTKKIKEKYVSVQKRSHFISVILYGTSGTKSGMSDT